MTPAVTCNPPGGAARLGPADLFLLIIGSLLVLLVGGSVVGVRINLTASLPRGLYLAVGAAPARGSLVLACLPDPIAAFARERGYVPRGGACQGRLIPVGKQVLAIAGDTVIVSPAGLRVNGTAIPHSVPLLRDRVGRLLPRLATGRHLVSEGELWLGSTYSRWSFDSRYFGPLKTRNVSAVVRPLWTVRPTSEVDLDR